MRSYHRTLLLLSTLSAACGGAPYTTEPDTTKLPEMGDGGSPPISSGNTSSGSSTGGSTSPSTGSGSGSGATSPTMEAGVPSGATMSGAASGGSMVAGSGSGSGSMLPATSGGSMSGASGGSGSSVAPSGSASGSASGATTSPPTCSGPTSQACGNCNSGTQTRTCTAGVWDAWGACTGATPATLLSVGGGNFTISFDLTDTTSGEQAVVNQRTDCASPSSHSFWDVRLNTPMCPAAGSLQVDTYNPVNGLISHCTYGGTSGHHIELHRESGTLFFMEDGVSLSNWPDTTIMTGLAALATGTDVCQGTTLGLAPLSGTVSNLCVQKQ